MKDKQQCAQPITKDDFQCLLVAKISQSNPKVVPITTSLPLTKTTLQTTKLVKTTKPAKPIRTTKETTKIATTNNPPSKIESKLITNDVKVSEKSLKTSYSVENNIKSNFAKGIQN